MTLHSSRWIVPFAFIVPGWSSTAHAQVATFLESDSVRVYSATSKVGYSSPVHTHVLPHATYVASGGIPWGISVSTR